MTIISYLRDQQLVTEEQLEEARHRADRSGGSVENALFVTGAVNESDLLAAIRACRGWRTVSLTNRSIEPETLRLLPQSSAWEQCLLPLQYDPATKLLSLACPNPDDPVLGAWLRAHLSDYQTELYAAVEPIIRIAIIEQYRQVETDFADRSQPAADGGKLAYIISDRWRTDQFLGHLLSNEGYRVFLADSPAELLADLPSIKPDLVLVRKAPYACPSDYLESFRSLLPKARIRRFDDLTDLVDPQFDWAELITTQTAHTRLAANAAARAAELPAKQAVRLGPLVEQMCRRMRLSVHERLATVTIAYLFDIAAIHFQSNQPDDRQQSFFMLLSSAGDAQLFPPATLRIVRQMYRSLSQASAAETNQPEFRQGNVLTGADFYLQNLAGEERLTPFRLRTIEEHLRRQVGQLLLPDVVEALLSVLEEEVVTPERSDVQGTALVLNQLHLPGEALRTCIQQSGFEFLVTERLDAFVQKYRQLGPEVMIIAAEGDSAQIRSLIDQLAAVGIIFANVPTILLHNSEQHDQLYALLRLGLYDVIRAGGNFEVLDLRLQRISAEVERASRQRLNVLQDLGTHGSLVHMNVIDLLQAMGPSNKTMRISVTAQARQLTMYLHNGQLIYAQTDDKSGCDAVYDALQWSRGIWSVDHIDPSDLPEANVHRSIDSILIEGCHLLDEMQRQPAAPTEDTDEAIESIFQD